MSGATFFPEKNCSLSLGFFKLSVEECTVGVTNPWNWVQNTLLRGYHKTKSFCTS